MESNPEHLHPFLFYVFFEPSMQYMWQHTIIHKHVTIVYHGGKGNALFRAVLPLMTGWTDVCYLNQGTLTIM